MTKKELEKMAAILDEMNDEDTITISKASYMMLVQAAMKVEKLEAREASERGERLSVDTSDGEKAAACYRRNVKDTGRNGRAFEVLVREYILGTVERVHPLGVSDISAKCGAIECKSGRGWIVNPVFDTAEEALCYYYKNRLPMNKARYIVYTPYAEYGINGARVYTQRTFLDILEKCGLITAKKSSRGAYGIAIQVFSNSAKKEAAFLDALDADGETLDSFITSHII